jgi:hypothetical protein
MNTIHLEQIFNDNELVLFINEITNQLYDEIKDDYIPSVFSDLQDQDAKLLHATKKMNVILDLCRNSSDVKKLSTDYTYNADVHNQELYDKYFETITIIHQIYLSKLRSHPDYPRHQNKIINLYSGMKHVPFTNNDCTISLKLPIDTTARPIQDFVEDDTSYYINFKVKLDDQIIPIIGNCYKKLRDLGYGYYDDVSEYEFLFIGKKDYNISAARLVKTSYTFNYQISLNMYPIEYINTWEGYRSTQGMFQLEQIIKGYQTGLINNNEKITKLFIEIMLKNIFNKTDASWDGNYISTFFYVLRFLIKGLNHLREFIVFTSDELKIWYEVNYDDDEYVNEEVILGDVKITLSQYDKLIKIIVLRLRDFNQIYNNIKFDDETKKKQINQLMLEKFNNNFTIINNNDTKYIVIDLIDRYEQFNNKYYAKYLKYKDKYIKLKSSV